MIFPAGRKLVLTTVAMTAFAGNSLLCRAALRDTDIDAATFTSVRLVSGALIYPYCANGFGVEPCNDG